MGKGFEVCREMIQWIKDNIPTGNTILELGSGKGSTQHLCDDYILYSIEHEAKFLNKFKSTYIHAPIKDDFYDPEILKIQLPKKYDLLLIDGPPRKIYEDGVSRKVGRRGFMNYTDLFYLDCPIIIDDIDRGRERHLIEDLSTMLNRKFIGIKGRDHRGKSTWFGLIEKKE
jgi:hypothetical protein